MIFKGDVYLARYLRKAIRLLSMILLLSNAVGSVVRQLLFPASLQNLWDSVQWNEHVHWPDDYGITVVQGYRP